MANELPPLPQWLALTAEQDRDLRACIDDYARAAVLAEREANADACEAIADDYQLREGHRYPELKSDANTGAEACAAAIRARSTP